MLVSCAAAAHADKRALLVGIDLYHPDASAQAAGPPTRQRWVDLDGAVNDALSVRALLLARYGFRPDEIHLLTNEQATRARILDELSHFLDGGAKPGDVRFFYYAGHGSQIRNSLSPEPDKYDETLVPHDAAAGAADLRDKELARLLAPIAARGAALTVVLDSCHSGSGTRGLPRGKERRLEPIDRDVKDGSAAPDPIHAGALVLSAALDSQTAGEEEDEDGRPHGAFTLALLEALRTSAVDESIDRVFLKAKACLQRNGRPQEPVLGAGVERKRRSLLGAQPSGKVTPPAVPLEEVRSAQEIALQGGRAHGLTAGSELVKVVNGKRSPVRLRLTEVTGPARSTAALVAGKLAELKPGDLFVLDKYVAADVPSLRVFVPPALPARASLALVAQVASLRGSPRITWVEDPTVTAPTHVLWWNGQAWALTRPDGNLDAFTTPPLPDELARRMERDLKEGHLALAAGERPSLYLQLPPTPELAAALKPPAGGAVEAARAPSSAHYLLACRPDGSALACAWVMPNLDGKAIAEGLPLPLRTDWVAASPNAGARLAGYASRLGRMRAWLELEAPDAGGFPYRLMVRNTRTHEERAQGTVYDGESEELVLRADRARLQGIEPRRVYVFVLDSSGATQLLFPLEGIENRFPVDAQHPPDEIVLGQPFRISPPFGNDTYFLLSSEEAIGDPTVLNGEGVRTRGAGGGDPLSSLLGSVGTRGVSAAVPAHWSIEHFTLRSAARAP